MNIGENADSLLRTYSGDVPGASIAVVKDGRCILERSYGCAKMSNFHATSSTNYQFASLSKAFTAIPVQAC